MDYTRESRTLKTKYTRVTKSRSQVIKILQYTKY